jgi:23S rRNA (uridine2552-2'-O)-methyltransferase
MPPLAPACALRRITQPCAPCRVAHTSLRVRHFSASQHSSSSTQYLNRQLSDPYVRKRIAAGYRSRSAFKLVELDARANLLTRGATVVDLGSAPGGWAQVAVEAACAEAESLPFLPPIDLRDNLTRHAPRADAATARSGRVSFFNLSAVDGGCAPVSDGPSGATQRRARAHVFAVDLALMAPLKGVQFVRGDAFAASTRRALRALLPNGRADVVLSDMAHSFTGSSHTDSARQAALTWAALDFSLSALRVGGHWCSKVRYGDDYALLRSAVTRLFGQMLEVKPPASRMESPEVYLVGKRLLADAAFTGAETEALSALGVVSSQ